MTCTPSYCDCSRYQYKERTQYGAKKPSPQTHTHLVPLAFPAEPIPEIHRVGRIQAFGVALQILCDDVGVLVAEEEEGRVVDLGDSC